MASAYSRAAKHILRCSSGLAMISFHRFDEAVSLSPTNPVIPLLTRNFGPPLLVTTTGTAEANASITTFPKVSVREGNTNRSILA